jgi:hypothetical protein
VTGGGSSRSALAEKYMPVFDVREQHEARVPAPAAQAYAAFRSVDINRSRVVRAIFGIRNLPARLSGRARELPRGSFLAQALSLGWVLLEEIPDRELLAGAVTRPWDPVVRFTGVPPEEFLAFREPGFAKIVWGLAAAPVGASDAILRTETRVQTTDPDAARRFRRYWFVFSPGIHVIRRFALRLTRRDLERAAASRT